jgi:hypothetical protein
MNHQDAICLMQRVGKIVLALLRKMCLFLLIISVLRFKKVIEKCLLNLGYESFIVKMLFSKCLLKWCQYTETIVLYIYIYIMLGWQPHV